MTTLREAIERASSVLKSESETHALDAQVLLAHVLRQPRAWILAHPEYELDREEHEELDRELEELERGVPLPYVLGSWEFFGLEFQITPDVLIPRPETELLVAKAIDWLKGHPQQRWGIDVGTGSGCIAVVLAYNVEDLRLMASDLSKAALKVAQFNAWRLEVKDRIDFIQADLLPPVSKAYDLICANLPYIPTDTLRTLKVFGREPSQALDGGADGLAYITQLLEESRQQIARGGCMFLEIEASQGRQVMSLAEKLFPDGRAQVWSDLAGYERLLEINLVK